MRIGRLELEDDGVKHDTFGRREEKRTTHFFRPFASSSVRENKVCEGRGKKRTEKRKDI